MGSTATQAAGETQQAKTRGVPAPIAASGFGSTIPVVGDIGLCVERKPNATRERADPHKLLTGELSRQFCQIDDVVSRR